MTKRTGLEARSSAITAAITAGTHPKGKNATAAQEGRSVGLTVRLQPKIHDQLRKLAFDRRVSIHSLILEGVDFIIRKHNP